MISAKKFLYSMTLILFASCGHAQEATKVVETATINRADVIQSASFLAELKAKRSTHLLAEVQGVVEKIQTQAGQSVRAGTLLAELKNAELSARFKAADDAEDLAKIHLERCQKLHEKKFLSHKKLEDCKASYLEARQREKQALRELNQTRFVAPFDGVCGVFQVTQGQSVQPGDIIVSVYDPTSLELEISLPQDAASTLNPGAEVTFDGGSGRVVSVDGVLNPKTRMALSRADVSCAKCLIGSHLSVRIALKKVSNVLAVPQEALFVEGNTYHVWRIQDGKAQSVAVQLGLMGDKTCEVLSGLNQGDQVVIKGLSRLYPGASVQILTTADAKS
ncbi:MAG: efflux RND transporter periplasmic adaptor subunit [Holosporales bacterium]